MHRLLPVCLLPLVTGCLATGARSGLTPATPVPATVGSTGVVFVANGAGDFNSVSNSLSKVVAQAHAPLQIETVSWSLGYRRYFADHVDHDNHLAHGRRLAAQVVAFRQACPGRKVYLVGHSAGCAVILAAGEALPPGSVERIVLLAPSVCAGYDLRPALRSARDGVDVFYSGEDRFILGLGMRIFGTSDRACRVAAGQFGFTPVVADAVDAALYARLRQHAWDPAVAWSGHDGGHQGSIQPGFLRAYVLPLISPAY